VNIQDWVDTLFGDRRVGWPLGYGETFDICVGVVKEQQALYSGHIGDMYVIPEGAFIMVQASDIERSDMFNGVHGYYLRYPDGATSVTIRREVIHIIWSAEKGFLHNEMEPKPKSKSKRKKVRK
jgi:hypothetical protein